MEVMKPMEASLQKIKMIISGCSGYMGKAVAGLAKADGEVEITAGIDVSDQGDLSFPVYTEPKDVRGDADVLVDFSIPSALKPLLDYGMENAVPLVLCTTGYTEAQLEHIRGAANRIPIFKTANLSIGINLLLEFVRRAAFLLGDGFDIEILEKHHSRKIDAPSGTALMLANAAKDGMNYSPDFVFDRSGIRKPRSKTEIGISAIRGGTIPGEHSVLFAGKDEVIELKHSVYSREVFAAGALRAAKFMAGCKQPGLYDMSDVLL
jgi:4-hydroxy-tetrahydrodipicolinate reductase